VKLYHFTALEYIESIEREGLTRGDVPLKPKGRGLNGVWLTRNPDVEAQGWASKPRVLSDEERADYATVFGKMPPPGSRIADKRAVRITVDIPGKDSRLKVWTKYARLRGVKRDWMRALDKAGGGSSSDWFVYFGEIPPEWIQQVEVRAEREEAVQAEEGEK
jgi:hypothetical protein